MRATLVTLTISDDDAKLITLKQGNLDANRVIKRLSIK